MITVPDEHMRQMDISFCGKVATNIVTSDAKQTIIDSFHSLIESNRFFNRSQNRYKYANLVNKTSITYLSKQPHLITLKTGGSNYFLFLTKINGVNNALFIDCKTKQGYSLPRIITTEFKFSDDLFNGTVFDGEIVRDKSDNWMFLISNIVALKGRVVNQNIVSRMNLIYKILNESYNPDPILDICPIKVKKIYRYSDYDKLILLYIQKYDYEIRGIFFNSLNNKYSNHLFMMSAPSKKEGYTDKRKTRSTAETKETEGSSNSDGSVNSSASANANSSASASDTCIFQIKSTDKPEIYDLYAVNNSSGVVEKYSIALIKKMAVSKMLNKYFYQEDKDKDKSCFCNCKYNSKFNKWEVLNINSNVSLPDSQNTIKNMEE